MSADPVVDMAQPLQMNGYTYATGNPIGKSDPTGLYTERDGSYTPPAPDATPKSDDSNGAWLGHWWDGFYGSAKKQVVSIIHEGTDELTTDWHCVSGSLGACGSMVATAWTHSPQNPAFALNMAFGLAGDGKQIYDDYADGKSGVATGELSLFTLELVGTKGIGRAGKMGEAAEATSAACKGGIAGFFDKLLGKTKEGGTCNSFAAGTLVLLANGTSKAIETLTTSDAVLADDTPSGSTNAEPVVATITGHGLKHLVTITVDTDGHGTLAEITATDGHPFWLPQKQQWTDAGDLHPGDRLQTPAGIDVQIIATSTSTQTTTVYNLTVRDLHTYYVMAGNTPVLVHNDDACPISLTSRLTDHEAAGGHTIERHVGRTDQQLVDRNISAASTFVDIADAESSTAMNIALNREKVAAFLAGPRYKVVLNSNISVPWDRVYLRDSQTFVGGGGVETWLVKNPNMPEGFHVETSYPVP